MELYSVDFFKFHEDAKPPQRNKITDAGLDLYALMDTFIPLNETIVVRTGVGINIPDGYVGLIHDRSSMAAKGLAVGGGVIDAGYAGEVSVIMHNLTHNKGGNFIGQHGYWVYKGDKIAQLLIQKIETPQPTPKFTLWNSDRGDSGFGSSGR